jgi:tRNA modification GTPase
MAKPDVVAAIATASGRAAIGVVRLSGPELHRFMLPLLGRAIPARYAVLTDFRSPTAALDSDCALSGPRSTGEDVLELQGHGGMAVLQLAARCGIGSTIAEPGEFSRRALNENCTSLRPKASRISSRQARKRRHGRPCAR